MALLALTTASTSFLGKLFTPVHRSLGVRFVQIVKEKIGSLFSNDEANRQEKTCTSVRSCPYRSSLKPDCPASSAAGSSKRGLRYMQLSAHEPQHLSSQPWLFGRARGRNQKHSASSCQSWLPSQCHLAKEPSCRRSKGLSRSASSARPPSTRHRCEIGKGTGLVSISKAP